MRTDPARRPCWNICCRLATVSPRRLKVLLLLALSVSLLVGPAFTGPASAGRTVRLATLEWAPYIGKDLPAEGYAGELIRTAFERSGYQVTFFYMPWQRAVKTVLEGSYDGLCPAYYTEKRAKTFSLSADFPAGPLVFAKRKDKSITFNRLEDLKPYKIAGVRGYANTKAFDSADYLQKSYTNSDRTGYRRLLFGHVDLWLADKFVAQYTMSRNMPERAKEIDFVAKPLAVKNLYVAFSKSKPDYKTLTRDFNRGLAEVLHDGTLQKILADHGLSLK
jgi:polar amino acid transport system substrate-binding protein